MNSTLIDLHAQHGSLVRTAPNEVSVSSIPAIRKIYAPGTKFRKSDWYSVWQGHRKFDLFAERDERIHGEQRRLVSRAYSMDALKDLEPFVEDSIKVFMAAMEERVGKVVDLGNWVQLFAFGSFFPCSWSRGSYLEADLMVRCHRRSVVQQTLRLHGCRWRRRFVQSDRDGFEVGLLARSGSCGVSILHPHRQIPEKCSHPQLLDPRPAHALHRQPPRHNSPPRHPPPIRRPRSRRPQRSQRQQQPRHPLDALRHAEGKAA